MPISFQNRERVLTRPPAFQSLLFLVSIPWGIFSTSSPSLAQSGGAVEVQSPIAISIRDARFEKFTPPSSSQAALKLKSILGKSESAIQWSAPWQSQVFEDEVLPLYPRFFKNFEVSAGTEVSGEVDLDLLKTYVKWAASPKKTEPAEVQQLPTAWVIVRTLDESCGSKCMQAEVGIKKLAQARLARRGFQVEIMKPEEVGQYPWDASRVTALLLNKKGQVGIYAQLRKSKAAEGEANREPYQLDFGWVVRGSFESATSEDFVSRQRVRLGAQDLFETLFSRLMTETTLEIGNKIQLAENQIPSPTQQQNATELSSSTQEVEVQLNSIQGFSDVKAAKEALAAQFPQAKIFERKVSRVSVTFVVQTQSPALQARQEMKQVREQSKREPASIWQKMEVNE